MVGGACCLAKKEVGGSSRARSRQKSCEGPHPEARSGERVGSAMRGTMGKGQGHSGAVMELGVAREMETN